MMRALLTLFALIALTSCATSRTDYSINYTNKSKLVFVNMLPSSADYIYDGLLTVSHNEYPVDWGLPEMVEAELKQSVSNPIVSREAPESLALYGSDIPQLRQSFRARNIGGSASLDEKAFIKAKAFFQTVCSEESADAIVMLGTNPTFDDNARYWLNGYGLLARGKKRLLAFTTHELAIINCQPLDYATTLVARRSMTEIDDMAPLENVDELSPDVLKQLQGAVNDLFFAENPEFGPPLNQPAMTVLKDLLASLFSRDEAVVLAPQ